MLDVDVERIEAGGAGDAGDLDGAHEPHRHRRHHLVPLELLLDIVVQDVAYRHGGPSLLPWRWPAAGAMLPRAHPRSEQAQTTTRAIRRIGIEIGLGLCAYSASRVAHRTSARRGACFGRFAQPLSGI